MTPRIASIWRCLLWMAAIAITSHAVTPLALVCLQGSYWSGQTCVLCPGGTYGDRPGLTTPACSGPCSAGHFCPRGSTRATQNVCGSARYYCPHGSAHRHVVGDGAYTVTFPRDDHSVSSSSFPSRVGPFALTAHRQWICEPGFYCIAGVRRACPAGTFGNRHGLLTADCVAPCPLGSYCPLGTSTPLLCPPGSFGRSLALTTSTCSGECPIGHYCPSGTVQPRKCPAGSYGGVRGLTRKECSQECTNDACVESLCPAGYYCPLATTTPLHCGDVSVYCPKGASLPTPATIGHYTIRSTAQMDAVPIIAATADREPLHQPEYIDGSRLARQNQTTRDTERECELGTYCVNGVKRYCPAGTYGDRTALSTAACSGDCPPGYYCPLGSFDLYMHPCNARDSFCPSGSALPTPVTTGYFTVTVRGISGHQLRVSQTICPMGNYCTGGIQYPCPAGTYGATTGLSSPSCSGRCQDGFICPTQSTSNTQIACAGGEYTRNALACAPCLPGFWCSTGSPDPRQHDCGGDEAYCPLGSSQPASVEPGYYAMGQTVTTHTAQQPCTSQRVVHVPQCASRTVV